MTKLLHVGCGATTKKNLAPFFHTMEETRVDIDANVYPDFVCSMQYLDQLNQPNTYDYIYCSHALEHLYTHEVPKVLAHFNTLLNRTGICILLVPNLEDICRKVAIEGIDTVLYTIGETSIRAIDCIYGYTTAVSQGKVYMQHLTGFTPKYLLQLMLDANFLSCGLYSESVGYNLACIASKHKLSEFELTRIVESAFKNYG